MNMVCNGLTDCKDHTDEIDCGKYDFKFKLNSIWSFKDDSSISIYEFVIRSIGKLYFVAIKKIVVGLSVTV